ncbi:SRPBCC family protein [Shewanella sedimentimangrovi]|uniref:SRPBCC family protein n=1 Tax=Shewanella sedimentimangrovi TaxID=2814293 RepID=A0ABX7R517_9GAMM|nr:SRPBCC family protein [Shewanella sedimentimangrovi]QSX38190.1 SRPBCC family protein [Shewanella sedimentimangrovi]
MGKCYNTVEIAAPIDKVWKTVSNFHDMSWAKGVITSLEKVGDKGGNEVGAKRVLNNVFKETLTQFHPDKYSFSYSIDDGPGPVAREAVSHYIGVVKLSEKQNTCVVEWSSSFESANEEQVSDFCNPIYRALLDALKNTLS